MLKRLYIRNYALIEELEIIFSEKLTIVTGETGAGKSILLGALELVMGERADSKIFYNDLEKCIVEAYFDVSAYNLRPFFEEHELDYDTEVVIRRELSPGGKSRAFVNDTPTNNQVLRRLTENLVDLHQQFDTLDIHNVSFQLRMIDALADNQARLSTYQEGYRQFVSDKKRLAALIEQSQNGIKEMEFLRFQLSELRAAELVEGEQERLEAELARLSHAEEIKQTFGAAYHHISESDMNIVGQLKEIARTLAPSRKISPVLASTAERFEGLVAELQDLAKDCERIAENTEHDPQRIAEVQERLDVLYKLLKKHHATDIGELLRIQADWEAQTAGFTNLDRDIAALEQSVAVQEAALHKQALELSERRKSVVESFEKRVQQMLAQLAMLHARLSVVMNHLPQLGPSGFDDVQFLFATNAGSRPLPIKDVASGGELSRLTLCTKSLVADAIPLPTLIFDEIDAGISGDVSLKMGTILKELSQRHQVVSITHTPQIAARADTHYFVYKQSDGKRTTTKVRLLNPEERVRSIAVMLSGNPPSEAAVATARELVG